MQKEPKPKQKSHGASKPKREIKIKEDSKEGNLQPSNTVSWRIVKRQQSKVVDSKVI
jgi:hypothetical protein